MNWFCIIGTRHPRQDERFNLHSKVIHGIAYSQLLRKLQRRGHLVFEEKRTWGPKPKYPLVSMKPKVKRNELITIAGPCSIEDEKQVGEIAEVLSRCGVSYMRGGVFRAGTYPPDDYGFHLDNLRMLFDKAYKANLKIIVEILDVRQLELIDGWASAFQIGARHMQDYVLLGELSKTKKPVFLKRNMGATLDEFLGSAEYLCKGKCQPHLIERGSSTFHNHVRWDLSMSIIATIKTMTGLPILVDASHGTGRRDLVYPMTMAGIAAGADGFLCEVHPDPELSVSDADQAYLLGDFPWLKEDAESYYKLRMEDNE